MLHVSIWEIPAGFPIAPAKQYCHRLFKEVEAPLQHKSSQCVFICHWANKFSTDIFVYDCFKSANILLLTGIVQLFLFVCLFPLPILICTQAPVSMSFYFLSIYIQICLHANVFEKVYGYKCFVIDPGWEKLILLTQLSQKTYINIFC